MRKPSRVLAILLVVAGAFSLYHRGFSYTKETHEADIGGLHLQLDEKKHVRIPPWVAAVSVGLGILLLLKSRDP